MPRNSRPHPAAHVRPPAPPCETCGVQLSLVKDAYVCENRRCRRSLRRNAEYICQGCDAIVPQVLIRSSLCPSCSAERGES